jgi:hypothetical protein
MSAYAAIEERVLVQPKVPKPGRGIDWVDFVISGRGIP